MYEQHFSKVTIGKRYTRIGELGIPFVITVDSTSLITIWERNNKDQIRINIEEVGSVVKEVTDG